MRRAASAVEVVDLGFGQSLVQERSALGDGHRERDHSVDLRQVVRCCRARQRHEIELDAHDYLALDKEVEVERQRILRDIDGTFDCVLDRHESEVDIPVVEGGEHLGYRDQRHERGLCEIGLGDECGLGKRAVRTHVADPRRSLKCRTGYRSARRSSR